MANGVLLDTCAAIWLMNGDPMTVESREAIRLAQSRTLGVYISPISSWEIGTLVAKGKLQLSLTPEVWFARLLALPGTRLAEMTPSVLIASEFLPGKPPSDPADRILATTARTYDLMLITRNGELMRYAKAGHIRAIGC